MDTVFSICYALDGFYTGNERPFSNFTHLEKFVDALRRFSVTLSVVYSVCGKRVVGNHMTLEL